MAIKKLGEILINKELIDQSQLSDALETQRRTGGRLGDILIEKGAISEDTLVDVMSERLKTPRISLKSLIVAPHVISSVPVELARRHVVMPIFRIGKALTIAMADPLNIIAVDEIAYVSGCDIRRTIASEKEIKAAIERYYSVQERIKSVIGEELHASGAGGDLHLDELEEDAPVVQLVRIIINRAVKEGASDIHIEPDESTLRIRYRVNSRMREEASPPKRLQSEIISRIKIAAELDVSEKRTPQDGRFSAEVDDVLIDLRVSTLPTIHGEKIVIRILDPRKIRIGLSELGFKKSTLESWRELIYSPEGLILLSGPTSSGKTTTLYSSLQEINSIEKNIITIEDPVEYSISLINQVQTNDKAGLTFAVCLRSILRQNPDVIMVGEIRDSETAQMAVRSSLTGHLVFSTIHTNDSCGSVSRLVDIGVERYLVASALKGVLAQRLVRLNCPECLEEYNPPAGLLEIAGLPPESRLKRSAGCPTCRNSGHQGMTAIYELLTIDETIREMIIRGDSDGTIRKYALTQGLRLLYESGYELLHGGRITLEELLQVALPENAQHTDRLSEPTAVKF